MTKIKNSFLTLLLIASVSLTASEVYAGCAEPNTKDQYGNQVHYSNKENFTFKPGCYRSCDGVCVIDTSDSPAIA